MENRNPSQIPKTLEVFRPFVHKKLDGLIKDFQLLFRKRLKAKLLKNHFFLLAFWQSLYIKSQKRVSDLKFLWKQNWRKYIENKNHYLNLITLVDAKTLTPIDGGDQVKEMEPPVFEEEKEHHYKPLKEGEVPQGHLDPSTDRLKGVSPKVIAALFGVINRLAHDYFSKTEKEMLHFREFPESLPKVISKGKNRPNPKRQNVMAFTGLKWEIILYIAYLSALASEMIVFLNLGMYTLNLEKWKAWLFSLVIVGVSYLLGLYFFRYVLMFLRSKGYVPKLYKLFLALVVIYVLASGFLSFSAGQDRRVQARYLTEVQALGDLQLLQFSDPLNPDLQTEVAKQQLVVDNLSQNLNSPSRVKTIVSAVLFVLMGFMSLFTSGMLLAVTLCVGKVNFLKRKMKRAEKALTSVEAEYEWRISLFKKARELMAIYIFELGRLQAIESLLVSPPLPQELVPNFPKSPKTPDSGTTTKKSASVADIEVHQPEEVLSETEYNELYNS